MCVYIYIYIYIYIYFYDQLVLWAETQETRVQSHVKSYQRLKKWYLLPPCLILSIIRYISRVKCCNTEKGVVPTPTPRCSSYWRGSLYVTLDYSHQLDFMRYVWFYYYLTDNTISTATLRMKESLYNVCVCVCVYIYIYIYIYIYKGTSRMEESLNNVCVYIIADWLLQQP